MRKLETLKRGDLIRFTFENGKTLNEIVLNVSPLKNREPLNNREVMYTSFVISFGKVLTYGISLKSDILIKKYKILSK